MATAMQFDDAFTKKLVHIYSTPDVIGQRDRVLQLANIKNGERALDIGTGPGMTTQALGEQVGHMGEVIGIDISDVAVQIARERCAEQSWVAVQKGDATDLQFEDGSFDIAISTQVYEYVDDIDIALNELHRVLRTGGRAVILDSDWDSCVWQTNHPDRMRRVIDAWNTHCPRPFLPRKLAPLLQGHGFTITTYDVYTILNPKYDANTYSYGVIDFIVSYIKGAHCLLEAEVDAWAQELHERGKQGHYFFSLNRYLFVVEKF